MSPVSPSLPRLRPGRPGGAVSASASAAPPSPGLFGRRPGGHTGGICRGRFLRKGRGGPFLGIRPAAGQSLWADLPPIHAFLGGIVPVDRLWAAAAVLPSSGPDTPWADSNSFSSVRRGRPSLPLSSPSNREHRLPAVVPARPSCLPRTGIYVRAGLSRPVPVTAA